MLINSCRGASGRSPGNLLEALVALLRSMDSVVERTDKERARDGFKERCLPLQDAERLDFIRMCATKLPKSDLTGEALIQIRGRDQEQQDAHEFCNQLIDYLAELKVQERVALR